jgi:hypothetical protein
LLPTLLRIGIDAGQIAGGRVASLPRRRNRVSMIGIARFEDGDGCAL